MATSGAVCAGAVEGIGLRDNELSPRAMMSALHVRMIMQARSIRC